MESCLTPASAAMESKDAPTSVWLEVRPGVRIHLGSGHFGKNGKETLQRLSSDPRRSFPTECELSSDTLSSYPLHLPPEPRTTTSGEEIPSSIQTSPEQVLNHMDTTSGQPSINSIGSSAAAFQLHASLPLQMPKASQAAVSSVSTLTIPSSTPPPAWSKVSKGPIVSGQRSMAMPMELKR